MELVLWNPNINKALLYFLSKILDFDPKNWRNVSKFKTVKNKRRISIPSITDYLNFIKENKKVKPVYTKFERHKFIFIRLQFKNLMNYLIKNVFFKFVTIYNNMQKKMFMLLLKSIKFSPILSYWLSSYSS